MYISAGRRTYLAMNILTFLMVVILVLFVVLYRSMKPKTVYLSSGNGNLDEGLVAASEGNAVSYRRDSDQVFLLEHMEDEDELEDEKDYKVVDSNEIEETILSTD